MRENILIQVIIEITRAAHKRRLELAVTTSPTDSGAGLDAGPQEIETIFRDGSHTERMTWLRSDLNVVREVFTLKFQRILNELDLETDRISVLEDSEELLTLRPGYCQHCGKKLLESYGLALGVVKRCRRCGKLSFVRFREGDAA